MKPPPRTASSRYRNLLVDVHRKKKSTWEQKGSNNSASHTVAPYQRQRGIISVAARAAQQQFSARQRVASPFPITVHRIKFQAARVPARARKNIFAFPQMRQGRELREHRRAIPGLPCLSSSLLPFSLVRSSSLFFQQECRPAPRVRETRGWPRARVHACAPVHLSRVLSSGGPASRIRLYLPGVCVFPGRCASRRGGNVFIMRSGQRLHVHGHCRWGEARGRLGRRTVFAPASIKQISRDLCRVTKHTGTDVDPP